VVEVELLELLPDLPANPTCFMLLTGMLEKQAAVNLATTCVIADQLSY
jgi:hypothetical protein